LFGSAIVTGSTTKKVIIHRFDREPLRGFVNPQVYLTAKGVELLTVAGAIVEVPFSEIKTVCFVKDFHAADLNREKRLFATRPKTEGLWVRMRFRDDDCMDGIMANNLLLVDPQGFTLVPPDASLNNQRVFVPRAALVELQVMGVVGSPLRKPRKTPAPETQLRMFD
jgi:hypothetical protein